jgi:palmitoyltransferase
MSAHPLLTGRTVVHELWSPALLLDLNHYRAAVDRAGLVQQLPSNSSIFAVCSEGDPETFEQMLQQLPPQSVNEIGPKGEALLHIAARRPSLRMVQLLLQKGANVNQLSNTAMREPPLHAVIGTGDLDIVHLLIRNGADPSAPNAKGFTALVSAAEKRRFIIVKYLLNSGAVEVDARDADDHTALHWAAYVGHAEITRVLINHGANVTAKDSRGMIPLHWAAAKGYLEVEEQLTSMARGNPSATEIDVHGQLIAVDRAGKTAEVHARDNFHMDLANYLERYRRVEFHDGVLARHHEQFTAPLLVFLLFNALALLFAVLPVWLYVILFVGAVAAKVPQRVAQLMGDNYPSLYGVFVGGTASQLILVGLKISPNIAAMRASWWLMLHILLTAVYVELFRRLVFRPRPGVVPHTIDGPLEVFAAMKRGMNPSGYCHSCVLRKPQRSKHCGDLDKCVERFDHHCLWTTRSVGAANHKQFLLFCVVMVAVIEVFTYLIFRLAWMDHPDLGVLSTFLQLVQSEPILTWWMLFFQLNSVALTLLLGFQSYIIANALTTNEFWNWRRYSYLVDATGAFENSLDRGPIQNCLQFWKLRAPGNPPLADTSV